MEPRAAMGKLARIRNIKPEFFRDKLLTKLELSHPELRPMLVFAGLWTVCDHQGRFLWDPEILHLDILPLMRDLDIDSSLELLRTHGPVAKYTSDGRDYGVVVNFQKHQRVSWKESQQQGKYPEPTQDQPGVVLGLTKDQPGTNPEPIQDQTRIVHGTTPEPIRETGVRSTDIRSTDKGEGVPQNRPLRTTPEPTQDQPGVVPVHALARGVLNNLQISTTNALLDIVAQSLGFVAQLMGHPEPDVRTADAMCVAALKGEARGEKITRFWFEDREYEKYLPQTVKPAPIVDIDMEPVSIELEGDDNPELPNGTLPAHEAWFLALQIVKREVNAHSFETWLRPTVGHATDGISLVVKVPTADFLHVGEKFKPQISKAVKSVVRGYRAVRFEVTA